MADQIRNVYMDNAGATRMLEPLSDIMMPYQTEIFGNPQALHDVGDQARQGIDEARGKVANLIGATPGEIIFTSCGSEANNLAIKGLALANQARGKHIVISAIEHFSVMNAARTMEKMGFELSLVPVDNYGVVNPNDVANAVRADTILVSIMLANSEVGTIEPIKEIAAAAKKSGAIFHTDAVAATGAIPVDVKDLGVDALSMAGNAFYGPKGTGALWLRRGVRIMPLIDGGVQEGGRRAGTENVPAIVGMGAAAEFARRDMQLHINDLTFLRDRLVSGLPSRIDHCIVTGHPTNRLPGTASFCIEFIEGESMLMLLNQQGVAASSGSACTSKALKSSHVLLAMGLPHEVAAGSLLFSLGLNNNEGDVDYVMNVLPPIVERLRQMSPLYDKFIKERAGRR